MKYFLLETDKKISQIPQIVRLHDKIDVRDIHQESAYKNRAQTAFDGKGRCGYLLSGYHFKSCFSDVAGGKKGCGDV